MDELEAARVIIFAKDMKAMCAFYEHTLGLARAEASKSSRSFVSFEASGIQVSLHAIPPRYARNLEISDPPVPREDSALKLAFRAADVAAAREALVRKGARMGPVKRAGTLTLCDGVDPEGNVFQLSDRP